MDEQQAKRVDEAAQRFADALINSYRTAAGRTVSTQQFNAELTQNFFNGVINNLRTQAEDNREMIQELVNQQQRQQEAARTLAQESSNAYMDFLNSMFSFYQSSVEEAERGAEEAERSVVGETERSTREVERSAEETARSAEETARSAADEAESQTDADLLLADYDSLNVREVSDKLADLSVEEIRQLRDYEVEHKNRQTLVG